MKKVPCYQCELCNEIYPNPKDAEDCEKAHLAQDTLSVVDCSYEINSVYGFPQKLLVESKGHSGALAEYRKMNEGPVEAYEPYRKSIDDDT